MDGVFSPGMRSGEREIEADAVMTHDVARRNQLGAFLRDRRGRVTPAEVGLTGGARRRTPGLRREEVARLADVGVSWYTWLEQGRDIHVSEALLERLAVALRLAPAERSYLYELAQGRSPRPTATPAEAVSAALARTIDAHVHPVVVTTPRGDIVAMNAVACAVWGDRRGTNSLWSMFVGPAEREWTPQREVQARGLVARFRFEAGRAADREPFDRLARELAERSPEFRELWGLHEVLAEPEGAKIVRHPEHPELGAIEFDQVALMHVEPDGRTLRVTFYTPRPGESEARATRLIAALSV